jgi:hypothetical protein
MTTNTGEQRAPGSLPGSVDRDFHGHPVADDETVETVIDVWEIEPAINADYDFAVIRCYQQAVEYAQRVVETLMDDSDNAFPLKIEIRQAKMNRGDYEELFDSN